MRPVRNTPSNVPAPPIETTGAARSPMRGRFRRLAPFVLSTSCENHDGHRVRLPAGALPTSMTLRKSPQYSLMR